MAGPQGRAVERPVASVDELYGTWRLVSWKRTLLDTGETVDAFGRSPNGILHYGRDGHVSWVMTAEGRMKPQDLARLTDADRAVLYNSLVAYAGTFTFDGKAATHRVQVSWNQVWNGTEQVRNLIFRGENLIMTTNPQAGVDGRRSASVFVWERAARASAR